MATAAKADRAAEDATGTPRTGRRKVTRSLVNFWLDAALFIALAFIVWVSALMKVVFPAPTAAAGWELWGLSYDQWCHVQFIAICAFGLLALEHLVLHWTWVCSVLTTQVLRVKGPRDDSANVIYGVGTFIVLLILLMGSLLAAVVMVHRPHP